MGSTTGDVVLYGYDDRKLPPSAFRTPWDAGPGQPFPVQYGSRPPLTWNYPLAANYVFTPRTDEGLPQYKTLRAVAKSFDLWNIGVLFALKKISARKLGFISKEKGDTASAKKALAPSIKKAEDFWKQPDKKNDLTWRAWIISVMKEVFVTDGVRLKIGKTFDGSPTLKQIQPEMMKPILDNEGDIVAWQQVRFGVPRTTYTYGKDEIYAPCFYPGIDSAYGSSHLEQILLTVDIGTQKLLLELARFTQTNVPPGILFTPPEWTVSQMEEYANALENTRIGDITGKSRYQLAPGTSKGYQQINDFTFDIEHEHVLETRICAVLGIPRSVFVDSQTRGGSNTVQDELADAGVNANNAYILKSLVGPFTERDTEDGGLGLDDIEPTFIDESTRDALPKAQERKIYVDMGAVSPDEVRDELGHEGPSPATLDAQKAEEMAAQGKMPDGTPMKMVGADVAGKPGQTTDRSAAPGGNNPAKASVPANAPGNKDNLAKEERAQWKRFAIRRIAKDGAGAPFVTKHIPPFEAWGIRKSLAGARGPADVAKAMQAPAKRLTESRKAKLRRLIQEAASNYLEAQLAGVKEHAPHFLKKDASMHPWPTAKSAMDIFAGLIRSLLSAVWAESAADASEIAKAGFSFEHFDAGADAYARTRAGELIRSIDATTRKAVSDLTHEAIVEGWGPDEFASHLEDLGVFGESRAETIARTEAAIAQNRGQLALLRELDIQKVRVYDGDFDEECSARNGTIISVEEAEANPIMHPNCTSSYSPYTEEEELADVA